MSRDDWRNGAWFCYGLGTATLVNIIARGGQRPSDSWAEVIFDACMCGTCYLLSTRKVR